ncbi:hypothetical protein HN592_00990 [Candidatus Woesearchaeota archaeon]|jgi:hypothetical protein|nr:hypothetical protein [Candidatus Woesearchaeota archaeon]MBT4368880.1 hypothetical protein [Candidatus Woesearchaeota archaeon]MBT4712169.1 hypothetical protein [Candidatus Woesearchaeota archaeon]MBT6639083.1 hypothetical protein [Candidatus Woesearchaeota archaeon]MBT7134283.1 hypothetical protein [Candidatus Woesearchaeota archaeon]
MFKLFKKEESKAKSLEISELHNWLDEELAQIDFSKEINAYFENLKTQKEVLTEKNEVLRTAQVSEKDKVEDRVRSMVVGQKNSFVTEVGRFINNLSFPEEQTIRVTINFNTELNKTLDELAQKTTKSYQATTHLFFNQVQEVYKSIGEINLQARKFKKKIERKKLDKIEDVIKIITTIQKKEEEKKQQEQDLTQKDKEINELEKEKKEKEQTIKTIKESLEYKQNIKLKEEKTQLQTQLKSNKEEVSLFFSKLGRALRKYQKVSMEYKLIAEYIEDPVTTFFNDTELKITEILTGLERSIGKKEVGLSEKQEKNTLDLLKNTKEGYLNIRLEKNRLLQEKINALNVDDSLNLKIAGEEDKINHVQKEIQLIQESKEKRERLTDDSDKAPKLKELALELFNTQLTIRKTI